MSLTEPSLLSRATRLGRFDDRKLGNDMRWVSPCDGLLFCTRGRKQGYAELTVLSTISDDSSDIVFAGNIRRCSRSVSSRPQVKSQKGKAGSILYVVQPLRFVTI
jgi:hypothetical protein